MYVCMYVCMYVMYVFFFFHPRTFLAVCPVAEPPQQHSCRPLDVSGLVRSNPKVFREKAKSRMRQPTPSIFVDKMHKIKRGKRDKEKEKNQVRPKSNKT